MKLGGKNVVSPDHGTKPLVVFTLHGNHPGVDWVHVVGVNKVEIAPLWDPVEDFDTALDGDLVPTDLGHSFSGGKLDDSSREDAQAAVFTPLLTLIEHQL